MPAKKQITRDAIIHTAVDMAKKGGIESINARNLAAKLKCSTQPIYFCFANMEELKQAVIQYITEFHKHYIESAMKRSIKQNNSSSPYKVYGMAYIQFAKEYKELFKMLFMRDRSQQQQEQGKGELNDVITMVQSLTGLDYDDAYQFQMEMWFYIHGIAAMLASNYIDMDDAAISAAVTDCFEGLKKQHMKVR